MNSSEAKMRALSRFALMLLLSLASGLSQAQAIGRVLIAVGEVSASRGGQAVNLGTGSAVENGDTIRVGPASNAQIRFNDEGIVALRPQTVFRIDDYNYAGRQDGAEKVAFNLIAGGMRTITGLVGKLNRNNYLVRTPTSTVGIRGTNYNLVQCEAACVNKDGSRAPTGTYGGVYDGSIGVSNQSGEKTFGAEEFFYVAGPAAAPQALIAPPSFLQDRLEGTSRRPNQKSSETAETTGQSGASADARAQTATTEPVTAPVTPVYVVTEQKTTTGASSVISNVTGFIAYYSNGTHGVLVGDCGGGGTCLSMGLSSGLLRGDSTQFSLVNNQLVSYSGSGASGSLGGGSVVDAGTVTIAGSQYGWGRWTGGFSVTDTDGTFSGSTAKSGVFFGFTNDPTVGNLTHNLPSSGTVNYVLAGGPSPVDTAGTSGSITSMSGQVNFTTRAVTFNMGLSITTNLGLATITGLSGGGTIAAGKSELLNASLGSGSCAGAGCASPSVSGNFDARFGGTAAQAMVVNGALVNAVQYSGPINRSVLFLNILKCSTC
jgi:hypothetical protein